MSMPTFINQAVNATVGFGPIPQGEPWEVDVDVNGDGRIDRVVVQEVSGCMGTSYRVKDVKIDTGNGQFKSITAIDELEINGKIYKKSEESDGFKVEKFGFWGSSLEGPDCSEMGLLLFVDLKGGKGESSTVEKETIFKGCKKK